MSQLKSNILNAPITTLNAPAVISHHISIPVTLVSLFHSANVLMGAFSLLFNWIINIFFDTIWIPEEEIKLKAHEHLSVVGRLFFSQKIVVTNEFVPRRFFNNCNVTGEKISTLVFSVLSLGNVTVMYLKHSALFLRAFTYCIINPNYNAKEGMLYSLLTLVEHLSYSVFMESKFSSDASLF